MAAIFFRRFLEPPGEGSRAEFLATSSQCPSKIILSPWNDLSFPDGVVGSHELPMWTVENRARYDRSRLRQPSGEASGPVRGSFAHRALPGTRTLNSKASNMNETTIGSDGKPRCSWCAATPDYQRYHDTEWGFPVADDRRLFEKLCLEGFQSGLSWRTILEKRENFRTAFKMFDFEAVAGFGPNDVERLLQNAGIVRHRGKIESVINNARRAQDLIAEAGSLSAFVWSFEPIESVKPQEAATALAKALKRRHWSFVGPTTIYAFMQAAGVVNDHAELCVIRANVERARAVFQRPTCAEKRPTDIQG